MSATSVTLHVIRGGEKYWLGEIVYTSTGMIAGVTEYGNFAYAWRAFGGDIESFLLSIEPDYFSAKLEGEFLRIPASRSGARRRADIIASEVLPHLQAHIRESRKSVQIGSDGDA